MTITANDIVTLAGVITALGIIIGAFSKPIKAINTMAEDVKEVKKAVTLHGDMIAELLEHSIDGNNTGKMKEAKKRFDDAYRHGLDE